MRSGSRRAETGRSELRPSPAAPENGARDQSFSVFK
jgi:hypothetical protein